MLATMLYGPGDIRFEEHDDPVIAEPADAIVRVIASCVCGSDLWPYRGVTPTPRPRTIGHECLGEVVEVGSAVRGFRPGDRVIVPFDHCDGTCPHCLAGAQSGCVNLGFTTSGQAELARVNQADGSLVAIPDGVPEDLVPSLLTLSDVMPTGWHAAVSAGVAPGATAVVVGDGAVGLCGVIAARVLGAERIIALSRNPRRQELARAFGATDVLPERGREAVAAVLELTDGIGADATLECVGMEDSVETAFAVARPGSRVGMVGVPNGVTAFPIGSAFDRNVGFAGGMAPVRKYLPELLPLVLDRAIEPGRVFDGEFALADVADAYRVMNERTVVKAFLRP